jgi:2-keto-4-pentenoate hydratase/2-oxohepta-3-ene-1,7-dioic acid hydratase in catechol pathway
MKIICIGRNYADHATELGNKVPSEPMFFLKPDSAILAHRHPLFIPEWTKDMHYEVELVVKIERLGKYIEEKFAHKYYSEVGIGIDFTARDIQKQCKDKGHPWEKAKAFDGSAAISRQFYGLKDLKANDFGSINFSIQKNGTKVQDGNSSDMIFSIDKIITYVSQFMTLRMGDMIFTGTPAGVGPVSCDDVLECFLEDRMLLKVKVK